MNEGILIGLVWTAAAAVLFLAMILRYEWRTYIARLRQELDRLFGRQHSVFPDYTRFSRMWDEEGSDKKFYPLANVEWKAVCRSELLKHRETMRKAAGDSAGATTTCANCRK